MTQFNFSPREPLSNQQITEVLSLLLRDVPGDVVAWMTQRMPWIEGAFVAVDQAADDLGSRYERLCADRSSDIWLHLPRMVELVHGNEAQHVIELGVRGGTSTVAWLHGLQTTGGRLTSVDVDPAPDLGSHPHWTFIQSDDLDPELIASFDPADIVFIDTTHTYEQTLAELEAYRPLVNPGGVIVLHDTELERDGRKEVALAVEEFCTANGLTWTNNPHCWGLGEIQIPR